MASTSAFSRHVHRSPELEGENEAIEMKNTAGLQVSQYAANEQQNQDLRAPLDSHAMEETGSTDAAAAHDQRDMRRLGKKQEFQRNFTFLSALGFVSVYMATWEFVLVSLAVGFANGGFAGLFWCYVMTVVCYSAIVASLAEMESMAPTSGGQYHWVSEFAPPRYQRILSYAAGWMSTLGWLASVASSNFVVATQVQAMIQVRQSDFVFQDWQYVLLMIAFVGITIVFNTWAARTLPALETVSLVGHLAGFLVVLIPLWVLCPKASAAETFTSFEWSGGWAPGPAFLVSQVTVMYCCLGSDSVVHISEEVEDASLTVPRCMWYSYIGNVLLGLVMLITMLFCIGPLDAVVSLSPHTGPFLPTPTDPPQLTQEIVTQLKSEVPYLLLFNATGSTRVSLVLNAILLILIYAGNITALATCARETWAFARDHGLPFSHYLGHLHSDLQTPFHAVYATSAACVLLSFLNFGSALAFNIVVSISLLGLLSTYLLSIGCVLLKRVQGQPLPPARWSLGRYGLVVNGFAFCYSAFIIIFCCFPSYRPVTAASANYGPLVWVAVMMIAVIVYMVHGRQHYTAPVEFVDGRKEVGVGLQSS